VQLEQDDVDRICHLVVDHGLNTQYVADKFDISRRRVQQLAKDYRDTDELPTLQTPGRPPYAEYPADLVDRIIELYDHHEQGAEAIAHVLRARDGLSIDNNRVHAILQEYEAVTENPNKQGRRRPWVRFEREFSLVTVHMDWFQNSREQWCLAVEDDASRKILAMIAFTGPAAALTMLPLFFMHIENFKLAQTMLFMSLAFFEIAMFQVIRRDYGLKLKDNKWLVSMICLSSLSHLAILYTPLSDWFGVVPLGIKEWFYIACSLGLFLVLEVSFRRILSRRYGDRMNDFDNFSG